MTDNCEQQMGVTVFSTHFEALTGFKPMRWQRRLYDEHFATGRLPSAVSVPTGLGKTAVMAIWMVALAQQLKSGQVSLPRRLVYVVDRRAVVDQGEIMIAPNCELNRQYDTWRLERVDVARAPRPNRTGTGNRMP